MQAFNNGSAVEAQSLFLTPPMSVAAKLWLVNYGHRTVSVEPHCERAINRSEPYNGIIARRMAAVKNAMLLFAALIMFGFFIHISIMAPQNTDQLKTYVSSQTQFSDFTHDKGSFWGWMWEDAMLHPKLVNKGQLHAKLVEFLESSISLYLELEERL